MERTLAFGPPGCGVADAMIAREVVPRLGSPAFASFWYVAPTLLRRREAEAATGRNCVPGAFMTLGELAARVSVRAADGMAVLTRAERRALVGACMAESSPPEGGGAPASSARRGGGIHPPDRSMPGLAQAIVKASSELAGAGVRDAEALPRGPLERTWRRYRQRLAALGMRDPEERLAVACSAIETGRVAAPSLAIVESVTDMRLLRALAARVERLIVVVELCGTPEAPAEADAVWVPLLSWARQAGAKPLRMGEPRAVDVRVTAFADRRAEVDGIATAIRDAGLLARDVVVAFTAIDDYAPLVRERFRGFGIPFEVARGLPLETAPVVRSAMALCEAVLAGFSRVAVERALASPHVRFGGLSYLRVDRLAREALVVGGGGARAVKSEWIEPLRRLEAPTEKASQFAETHIALLERALAMLAQLELPRSPREAARMLMGIWRRFGLGRRKTRERELSLLAKEAAAWERLLALTEETARGLWLGGVERVELRELVAALRAAIADERYDAPDAVRGERVRVVALRDVLGLRCTRVFVGGLDEATFPGAPPSALLLDSTRRKQLGLPLHAEEVALAKQRLCAAMAMAPAELSFPRGELAARDAAATMLLGLSASVGDGGSLGAPYTEERRQRLLARGDAPELAALSRASPAALAQALGAERSRERMELGGWDGILAAQVSPGLRAAVVRDLEARLLTSASVTQLDSYAGCPFRFFASRALGLLPLHDPLEVDTALAGRLVHAVLCDFYRNLRDARLLGRPEADWKAVARPQMQAALERQIDRLSPTRRDAFFAELVRYLGAGLHGNGVAGLLEAFLTCEAEALAEHEPVAFELPFGETPHAGPDGERRLPELVVEVPAQAPVRIAGVIDRVDRLRSTGGAVVFDYKTGRLLPRRSQLAEGYRFQLAVYLAAIASEMTPAAGGYYRLNDAAEITRDRFVDAEVASRVPAAVAHLAQWVRAGRFAPGHLPPRDKGCHFCDHKVICRVDHDRLHALALRRAAGVFIPLRLAREPQGRPSDSGLRGES